MRIRQLSRHPLLLLARKRIAETEWIELTPDELATFFLMRGAGSLNFAIHHLYDAMRDHMEWDQVAMEIRAKFHETL